MVILVAGCLLLVFVLLFLQPRPLVGFLAHLSPDVVFRIRTTRKVLALTIDDAPHPVLTPLIAKTLRDHGAKATFFVIGEQVSGNEGILRKLVEEGHELGNHDLKDRLTLAVRPDVLGRDLDHVDRLLRSYGNVKWFRPGCGWFSRRLVRQAQQMGYTVCLGSVYPHDAHIGSERLIRHLLLSWVHPGAVVILHDGRAARMKTVNLLETILPELKSRGYDVVTLSALMDSMEEHDCRGSRC